MVYFSTLFIFENHKNTKFCTQKKFTIVDVLKQQNFHSVCN
jgi:hypothetical protein